MIFLSFNEYTGLKTFFILFSILRGICKRIFANILITKSIFNLNVGGLFRRSL